MWLASALLAMAFVAFVVGAYDGYCRARSWLFWSRLANERLPKARLVK